MFFLLLGLGLVLYWAFWGLGLALWVLPTGWRRFLWAVCVPFGLAFQIGLVWWMIQWAGPVSRYGPWANALPVLLLAGALLRSRNRRWLKQALRSRTFVASAALIGVGLLLALLPIVFSPNHVLDLTTMSIGSRDAPDYALGGRFLLEKGQGTPGAYWGQYEQLDYRNFWMQFNHFGTAVLLAMAAATFHLEMWQLITVLTCALGACAAPLAMMFGYRMVGLRWLFAMGCGLLYALSPLWLHGAYHAAIGQMVGTLGAASFLLLALTLPASRGWVAWGQKVVSGSLALWLLVSAYPMMIFFIGAIVGGWWLWRTVETRRWSLLGRIFLWGGAVLGLCTVAFPARMFAVVRLALAYGGGGDGWTISPMLLSSVLGLELSHTLEPMSYFTHLGIDVAIGLMWAFGVVAAWRNRDRALGAVLSVFAVIFGAAYLLMLRDPNDLVHNSYKVYKLVAVFLPVVLPSLLIGLKASLSRPLQRLSLGVFVLIVGIFLPRSLYTMGHAAWALPLQVTPGLVAVEAAGKEAAVTSVNITTAEAWLTLWATALLPNKELHFTYGTYGHASGPLTGTWTLERTFRGLYPASAHVLGDEMVLRPAGESAVLHLDWGIGWWENERSHRWSGNRGRFFSFVLDAAKPMTGVKLRIDGKSFVPDMKMHAFIGAREIPLRQDPQGEIVLESFDLEAGVSEILFKSDQHAVRSNIRGDQRALLLNVRDVKLTAAPDTSNP